MNKKLKKHGSSWRAHYFTDRNLFYLSIIIFSLSLSLFLATVVINRNRGKSPKSVTSFSGYSQGVPITMGDATIELERVSFSDGQPGFVAPSGMHYLIVDFMVKNNSDHPVNVLPSSDTYLKTEAGAVSYLTPYNLERPFHAGQLLPGEQVKGQLSYVISKADTAKLYVDGIWSGGVVSFKVQ